MRPTSLDRAFVVLSLIYVKTLSNGTLFCCQAFTPSALQSTSITPTVPLAAFSSSPRPLTTSTLVLSGCKRHLLVQNELSVMTALHMKNTADGNNYDGRETNDEGNTSSDKDQEKNSKTNETPVSSTSSNTKNDNPTAGEAMKFVQRSKYWIVLVDDEESIRMSVGDFLYDEGFQVTACDSAASLLQLLSSSSSTSLNDNANSKGEAPPLQASQQQQLYQPPRLPDVIVSDVRMPNMDGIELLRQLKSDSRYQRIPVIMLTAKALTADRVAGYKAGADAYLPKPFYPEELLSLVNNVISRREQIKHSQGSLANMKDEMSSIKAILQQNSKNFVQKTNVYLTPTERNVLELVCQGYTNKEIAQDRGVSTDRIVKIVQKMLATTKSKNRTELVRWAFSTGYASPNSRQ